MMSIPIVVPHANGHKPHFRPAPVARVVPLLGAQVDRLLELRATVKALQDDERALTAEILAAAQAQGLRALQGRRAVALLESRTTLRIDPGLFLEAAGPRATEALTVSVIAARRLLGEDDLRAIAETTTTVALRVEPLDAAEG
jgi:hypothetical protein